MYWVKCRKSHGWDYLGIRKEATSGSFKLLDPAPGGTAVALWLRCCVTNRKVVGSIPDGFIGIFH